MPPLQNISAQLLTLLRPHLYGTVGLQEQVLAADAAVHAAQGHVQAEGEEVAVVEVAHAVVQPGWRQVQDNVYEVGNKKENTLEKYSQSKMIFFHAFFGVFNVLRVRRIRQWWSIFKTHLE